MADRPPIRVFYFGVWPRPGVGHYFFAPGGRRAYAIVEEVPWGFQIDGAILNPKGAANFGIPAQPEGEYVVEQKDGWTALAFWDRSGDSRPGSHSTFVIDAEVTEEEALAAARASFPEVFARLSFEIVPA